MSKKTKGFLSILFMAATFFLMLETKFLNAPGDYVLNLIGLKPWTGDYTGTHLTILYFMPLFIIGIVLVKKYVVNDLNIRWGKVFLAFIGLNAIFILSTQAIAKNVKANSQGLLAIGFEQVDEDGMVYEFEDGKYTKFEGDMKLTNYGKEGKEFYLMIDNKYEESPISFYNLDGSRVVFQLEGKESRVFSINLDNYLVKGGIIDKKDYISGGGSGVIGGIIVSDSSGEKVKIDDNNFFGISLGR